MMACFATTEMKGYLNFLCMNKIEWEQTRANKSKQEQTRANKSKQEQTV
jgi:hypothetical protein